MKRFAAYSAARVTYGSKLYSRQSKWLCIVVRHPSTKGVRHRRKAEQKRVSIGVLRHLSATNAVEDITAALERDGAATVEDLIAGETLSRFNRELDLLLELESPGH